MALLKIDERTLALNALCGAEETYQPTEQVKQVSERLAGLRTKLTEFRKKEEEFMLNEISPILKAIDTEIQLINETAYPELKQLREQQNQKKQAVKK